MSQVAKELSYYLTVMEIDKLVDLHACGLEMNAEFSQAALLFALSSAAFSLFLLRGG